MKIKKENDIKNSELKITVPIEQEVWKKEQKIAFEKIAKKVKVPGFRPGKAPLTKIKEYVSTVQIWEEAVSKLLNVAVKSAAELITEDDVILDSPTYTVEKITEDELEIIFIYPVFPEIKIKEYKKLNIKFNRATEKEIKEDVKKQIDKMLSKGSLLLPKEGEDSKVEKADTIIFDFKGYMNNEAFEGGEAEGFELKIGSGSFIPGFEDQLIGKKLGWEGDIKVKFPSDYYKEDFRDKEAKFEIKIHEIKYEDKPKLDDEYIKTLGIKGVSNEKELNSYLEDLSKRELEEKQRSTFIDELMKKVIEENEIPLPRTIVLKELQALMKRFEENLKQQGITKKEYYEITNYTDEKVREELKAEAEKSIKKSLLYTFFAKDLKIKASEEDIERQYQRISKLYNIDSETLKTMIKPETIEPQILNELVVDELIVLNNPGIKIEKEKVKLPKKEKEVKNDVKDSIKEVKPKTTKTSTKKTSKE